MKKPQIAAVVLVMLLIAYALFFSFRYYGRIFSNGYFDISNVFQLLQSSLSVLIDLALFTMCLVFLLSSDIQVKEKVYRYIRFIFVIDFFIYLPFRLFSIYSVIAMAEPITWYFFLANIITTGLQVTAVILLLRNKTTRDIQKINLGDYELVAYTSAGHRFVHYLVDFIFLLPMMVAWSSFSQFYLGSISTAFVFQLMILFVYLLYCFLSETIFKQTLGKMMTNSCVVSNGPGFSAGRVLVRTICRMIPFDGLSFLFRGNWHDKASSTSVVYVDTWQKVFEDTKN